MTSANADTLRDSASDTLDQLSPAIKEGKRQAGVLLDQGAELMDTVSARAGKTAADLGNSLIAYTKKNPIIALVLALGAGALLVGVAKSMQSRR